MTPNPNPSPEVRAMNLVHRIAHRYKNGSGKLDDIARSAFSWMQEADRIVAALSPQTPLAPPLSTDVQSAATGFHEQDVSLKVTLPAPGEVERAAVVAYIRRQSDRGADIGNEKPKGSTARAAFGGGSLALKRVADNIEAGEHILNDNAALATVAAANDEGVAKAGAALVEAWNSDGDGFSNTLPPIEFSEAELSHLVCAVLLSQGGGGGEVSGYRIGMFETPISNKRVIKCRGCGYPNLYWHNSKLHHWSCPTDDAEPQFVLHRCGFDSRGNRKPLATSRSQHEGASS